MKELTSDFGLFYSLLVVYHRAQNCFELEQLSLLNLTQTTQHCLQLQKFELENPRCPLFLV